MPEEIHFRNQHMMFILFHICPSPYSQYHTAMPLTLINGSLQKMMPWDQSITLGVPQGSFVFVFVLHGLNRSMKKVMK